MNETFKWAAARILFVMAMTFMLLTWAMAGAFIREAGLIPSVLAIVLVSVPCWAGFMACYATREEAR